MKISSFAALLYISAATFLAVKTDAIEPGGTMPKITAAKWYSAETSVNKTGDENKKRFIEIVVLFDVRSPDTLSVIRLLESLADSYADSKDAKLVIKGVAIGNQQTSEQFLDANGPFSIDIAVDSNLASLKAFAEAEPLFPFAVASKDSEVKWTGHPADLESACGRLISGKFSLATQYKISSLRLELQSAIQAGLPEVMSKVADKMLEISPDDSTAIQAKLFAFNARAAYHEGARFMETLCAKSPKESKFRLMLLDYQLANNDVEAFSASAMKAVDDFKDSPDVSLKIMTYLLDNAPFDSLDNSKIIPVAQKTAIGLNSARADKKAFALETLARLYANAGAFDLAVSTQSEAVSLRKKTKSEQQALRRLQYYKSAKELQEKLKSQAK